MKSTVELSKNKIQCWFSPSSFHSDLRRQEVCHPTSAESPGSDWRKHLITEPSTANTPILLPPSNREPTIDELSFRRSHFVRSRTNPDLYSNSGETITEAKSEAGKNQRNYERSGRFGFLSTH